MSLTPLWTLPLHDTPCAVCCRPAIRLVVFAAVRRVDHHSGRPCVIPHPSREKDCPQCGTKRVVVGERGLLLPHIDRFGEDCAGTGTQPHRAWAEAVAS